MQYLAKILESLSKHIAGLAFLGGFILITLGFFDIGDFKSVSLRANLAWPPVSAGAVFAIIGLLLHVFKPSCDKYEPESRISGGKIYILRHMAVVGDYRPPGNFAYALYAYNSSKPQKQDFQAKSDGWYKATEYSMKFLDLLGFVVMNQSGSEYCITEEGRKLINSEKVRSKFMEAFSKPLVNNIG